MSTSGINSPAVKTSLDSVQRQVQKPPDDSALVSQLLTDGSKGSDDAVDVSVNGLYKSLTTLADEVLAKLEEILGDKLPNGIHGLKPEDHTAEKTAQRIVDGSTALLGVFAKQHPELEGSELITEFMKTIRGGIDQGYSEADAILGDIGAYDISGVKDGIDQTKKLVEQGLIAFEENYRKQNGLTPLKDPTTEDAKKAEPKTIDQLA